MWLYKSFWHNRLQCKSYQRRASAAAASGSDAGADAGGSRLDAVVRCVAWQRHSAHPPAPLAPLPLSLQLLLQLIEEAPVGTLGNDLLWTAVDHAGLVQAEGIEAHCILRIILAPHAV